MADTEGYANGVHNLHTSEREDLSAEVQNFDTKERMSHKVINGHDRQKRRLNKRLVLLLTKPLYTLTLGSKNARYENRVRLRYLLLKLVRQHNWVEASGVLSELLKATRVEVSPQKNRMKYSVAIELLRRMDSDACSTKIMHLYDTWMKKIASIKNRPLKDRHVQLEFILSCLEQNNLKDAYQIVIGLMQKSESANDPISNLIIGLTNYELWYSTFLKETQSRNLDELCTPMESEAVENNSDEALEAIKGDDAASIYETCSNLHYHSETSVMNDKDANANSEHCLNGEVSGANLNLAEEHHLQFQSEGFFMNSTGTSRENDGSFQDQCDKIYFPSVFNIHGLKSLFPLSLPSLENMMHFLSSNRGFFNNYYKDALKYLYLALYSPPPASDAALLPLLQLLLLGGQDKETISVLEKACNESSSVLAFRLSASLWECFDANNYDKLSTCFEDVLKKDPTCRHSLARFVTLHQKGDYATEQLVEMIASHLEATDADYSTWREFAVCLLKLSHYDEDRISMCVDGEEVENEQRHTICSSRIPVMFVEGISGKTWKLRCKWWLNRHFSSDILTSEIFAGDLQLMTCKAACASHLYGREVEYVVRVHTHVKEHDRTMMTYLHMHIQNSAGFFSKFVKK